MSTLPSAVEELSFEAILNDKKEKLKELLPDTYNNINSSDPALALLEVGSYTEGLLRNRINNGLLAVMLDYAAGTDLDNLGVLFGISRKLIKEEDTTTYPKTDAVYEDDNALRERIKEAPKGFSVAGPKSAYVYYGKMADNKVKDISAVSESPMEIEVRVLSYDGSGEASIDLLKKVEQALNAEDVRPMGDKVEVKSAQIVECSINLNIVFKVSNVVDKVSILKQIKTNLENYVKREHKIGGLISLAGIYSASYLDYVEDVRIIEPITNIKCSTKEAPFCVGITVTELIE